MLLMSVGLILFNLADVYVKPNLVRLLSCNDSRASVMCAVHASTVVGCTFYSASSVMQGNMLPALGDSLHLSQHIVGNMLPALS